MHTLERSTTPPMLGDVLRSWRSRRRLSQLQLAMRIEVSTRHLSFVETGRSQPSREMILRLADGLEMPLRERNVLLMAGGYAPEYQERGFDDHSLEVAREAIGIVLTGHEPFPALAIDRHWTMLAANRTVHALLAAVDPTLLAPPVNMLRVSFHPRGLAPAIANLRDWRVHILERLRRDAAVTGDPALEDLIREILACPEPPPATDEVPPGAWRQGGVLLPLRLRTEMGMLNLLSTTTVFGTPNEVTVSEVAIESFFPADPATRDRMIRMSAALSGSGPGK